MNNPTEYISENVASANEIILLNETPAAPFYIAQLPSEKAVYVPADPHVKKFSRYLLLLKRLSPFLITCLVLPPLFMYEFIRVEGLFPKSLLCFKLLFAETYLAYFDVALWKYFTGKRKTRIWLIELVCLFIIGFFWISG